MVKDLTKVIIYIVSGLLVTLLGFIVFNLFRATIEKLIFSIDFLQKYQGNEIATYLIMLIFVVLMLLGLGFTGRKIIKKIV